MKVAGIRYLTNEYIVKALTNPVVIIALFTGIILFVGSLHLRDGIFGCVL